MHICWVPLCHSLTLWCALAAVYNVHFWLLQGEQTTGSCVWQLKPFSVATEPRLFAGHWAVQNKAWISQSPGVSLPGVTHPWLYAFSHATHIHKHIHADLGVAIWPMHSNEFVGHADFQKKGVCVCHPFLQLFLPNEQNTDRVSTVGPCEQRKYSGEGGATNIRSLTLAATLNCSHQVAAWVRNTPCLD